MKTLDEADRKKQGLAEDAVKQLNIALKSLHLYPSEHVVSRQAIEGLLAMLRAFFSDSGRLDLQVDKDHISIEGHPLPDTAMSRGLARDLFQLKLEALSFGRSVDARQLEALLGVLCMDPEEAARAGGAVELLWHQRTEDITVSEAIAKQVYEIEDDVDELLTTATDFRELQQTLFQDEEVSPENRTRLKAELFANTEHLADFLSYISGAGKAAKQGEIIADGAFPRLFSLARYDTIDDRNRYFRFIGESLFLLEQPLISAVASSLLRTESASTSMARRHLLERLSTPELCELLAAGADTKGVTQAHIRDAVSGLIFEAGRFDEIVPAVAKRLQFSDTERKRLEELVAAKQVGAITDPYKENPEILDRIESSILPNSSAARARLNPETGGAGGKGLGRSSTSVLRHLLASETDTVSFEHLVTGLERAFSRVVTAAQIAQATDILAALIDEFRRRSADIEKATAIKKAIRLIGRRETVAEMVVALEHDHTVLFADVEQFMTLLGNHGIVTLLDLLGDEKNAVRRNAQCKLLASCGRVNLSSLGSKVLDHRWYLVRNVVSILGQIGAAGAIRYLVQAASHRDPRVRLETTRALAQLGPEAFASIEALIKDDDKTVRLEALKSLGITRDPAAEPILIAIATRRDLLNRNLDERLAAVEGLAHLKTPKAISMIQSLANGGQVAGAGLAEIAKAALERIERERQ